MPSAPGYDPHERRRTPLSDKLVARIRATGLITIADYMRACLSDTEHGYYIRRMAIGSGGDFVTAPEVSQVFGELIGLWSVVVWQQMGAPAEFQLVEAGPGRGTMMADALRAASMVPAFMEAARVRLIEVNPLLRDIQRAALARVKPGFEARVEWKSSLAEVAHTLPAIVLGNEILDVEPVDQTIDIAGDRLTRCVGLDGNGRLTFVWQSTLSQSAGGRAPEPDATKDCATPEARFLTDIVELRSDDASFVSALKALPSVAALFIDYGHIDPHRGDTLQAVREHRFEHPLTSPGEADLTAQVDFGQVAAAAGAAKLSVDGPRTQAEFLGTLGIAHRGSRLMSSNPARALEIEAGIARLMSPTGMGTRFKAIGIRSRHLPPLPGFPLAV